MLQDRIIVFDYILHPLYQLVFGVGVNLPIGCWLESFFLFLHEFALVVESFNAIFNLFDSLCLRYLFSKLPESYAGHIGDLFFLLLFIFGIDVGGVQIVAPDAGQIVF